MSTDERTRWASILIWFTPALWAVNYWVARRAPGVIDPHMLAAGRWGLAGLILGWIARHDLWQHRQATWQAWREYVALGTLGMLVCGAWVYVGAQTTGAINISLIYAISPVLITLASVLWLGERMVLRQWLGVLLALVGVVHVVAQGHWAQLAQVNWVVGDFWIVLAACSWAGYAVLQKKWSTPLGSTARLAAICAGGMVSLLPMSVWEWCQADAPPASAQALLMVIVAALVPGIGAYGIYGWAQKVLGASRVGVTLYLGPLWGALVAWAVLGESLGWHHVVGAMLILPGVALVSRESAR